MESQSFDNDHSPSVADSPMVKSVPGAAPLTAKCCRNDHPNDPGAETCWICGDGFDPAARLVDLVPGTLAKLLFEDGTAVDVADDLMIGRSPVSEGLRATLTVNGRQISRQHLMVEIRGWRLYVRDCGSTNGTFLTRRGERGRRRVPTEDGVALKIGDSIHFGSRQALLARPTAR